MATFALDDPKASFAGAFAIIGVTSVFGAALNGLISYAIGYGASNLMMQAFPALQDKRSRFLFPGLKGQIGLFSATMVAPILFSAAKIGINLLTDPDKPEPKISFRP